MGIPQERPFSRGVRETSPARQRPCHPIRRREVSEILEPTFWGVCATDHGTKYHRTVHQRPASNGCSARCLSRDGETWVPEVLRSGLSQRRDSIRSSPAHPRIGWSSRHAQQVLLSIAKEVFLGRVRVSRETCRQLRRKPARTSPCHQAVPVPRDTSESAVPRHVSSSRGGRWMCDLGDPYKN